MAYDKRAYRCTLYHYTNQVGPRLGKSGSLLWSEKYAIMFLLRLISTSAHFIQSILNMFKAFEICVCCLTGLWLHLIPLHRPSWPQMWEFRFTCWVKTMSFHHGWGWYPPRTISYMHIWHIKSDWVIGMLSWEYGYGASQCGPKPRKT